MSTKKNNDRSNRFYTFIIWILFCLCSINTTSADQILVQAGDMKLMLEKMQQGIHVLSMFDNSTGQEILAPDTPPLFSLELRHLHNKEHVNLTADSGWRQVDISVVDASDQRILTFQEPADERLKGIDVEISLRTNNNESALIWDLHITNKSEQWSLWRIIFPQVAVKYLGEGSRVFLPQTAGIENSDLWNISDRKGGTYPSGWTCMQYMAAYDAADKTGLYLGMHDPFGSTKDIFAQGLPDKLAVAFRFEHPVPDMGKAGVNFKLPGRAKWQLLRGDWFDAAMIYRKWVIREAKWWPALGPDGRMDTPEWMRQLPAWIMTGGATSDCVPRVKGFAKEMKVPVGFHWYNWHQIPFDNDYPHYFPPKDGFAEGVAELKQTGVYPMPYINGRLWDTRDKKAEDWQFTKMALPAATKDENGKPYTESYGSKETDSNSVKLAAMCPSTRLWQNKVNDIVLRLFNEYGVSGVYIDQIAAARPRLCFDASHGHFLGGGHWWTEGYWQMLDSIRATKPSDCMLTTECNAEPYIKGFDGYLTWHWQQQNMVPAFSAVYGGAIQMFGRAYRGGPSQDLAHCMKAGQQLVFGEQIGWFGPEIIERPESGQFLRDCIKLRWQLRKYFYAGQMARPPKLIGDIPKVTADWQWHGEWPITTDAVMAGTWRLAKEKKVVLLFANVSDKAVSAHVEFDADEYGLSSKSFLATKVTPAGSQKKLTIDAAGKTAVEFPPQSVFAWELTEATNGISQESLDYLEIVRAYANTMIEHGRDIYGQTHSPLFAEELDRTTMRMLEGQALKKVAAISRDEWGIRPHDRMLGGSNPQHCQNLYQILYQLAEISGDQRYAEKANRSLKFFFEHCQSPTTGLLWWGEHAGWDLRTDKPLEKKAGDTHEFYRPWILWQHSWNLTGKTCERFARGLWEHQIGDHKTGDFSRHASIASHGPGTQAPYARHGGFYIETWAAAFRHTQNQIFLTAIRSVLDGLERARTKEGGMLVSGSKKKGGRTYYSVTLAISLEEAARNMPKELAERMQKVASINDKAFTEAHPSVGKQTSQIPADWSNAYGSGGPAAEANTCMLRYRQVSVDAYRKFVLEIADRYCGSDIDLRKPVWPGTMGNVILLMLNTHELTSKDKYLEVADNFAHKAVDMFLDDGCPLPKASHIHNHYEAVTNGDTLMMAFLKLWMIQNGQTSKISLVFTDR